MRIKHIYNDCCNFLKLCAKDVPVWMPEHVHDDPRIKEVESLEHFQKLKRIPIADFSESFEFEDNNLIAAKQDLTKLRNKVISSLELILSLKLKEVRKQLEESKRNKLQREEIKPLVNLEKKISYFKDYIYPKNFEKNLTIINGNGDNIQAGWNIKNIISYMENDLNISKEETNDLVNNFNTFEYISNNSKKLSLNPTKTYNIIFTTKPSEIFNMSPKSDFSACTELFGGSFKHKAVDAGLSPFIGMLYFTKESEKVEKLGRCLVIYTENDEKQSKLFFGPLYSLYKSKEKEILDIFKNVLSSKTSIPIGLPGEDPQDYHIPAKKESELPYLDPGVKSRNKTFENIINNPDISQEDLKKIYDVVGSTENSPIIGLIVDKTNDEEIINDYLDQKSFDFNVMDIPRMIRALNKCSNNDVLELYADKENLEMRKIVAQRSTKKSTLSYLSGMHQDKDVKMIATKRMMELGYLTEN